MADRKQFRILDEYLSVSVSVEIRRRTNVMRRILDQTRNLALRRVLDRKAHPIRPVLFQVGMIRPDRNVATNQHKLSRTLEPTIMYPR